MRKYVNGKAEEITEEEIAKAVLMERTRPLTSEEVTAMLIRQQINTLAVDDQTALRMTEFYPEWTSGQAYAAAYKVQYGGNL